MSILLKKRPRWKLRVTPERVIALGAVTAIGLGMAQPSIMSMAGLDFQNQRFAGQKIDPTPTGSIDEDPAARRRERIVHGLAGILQAIRSRN
jgi:hypothetical protein